VLRLRGGMDVGDELSTEEEENIVLQDCTFQHSAAADVAGGGGV